MDSSKVAISRREAKHVVDRGRRVLRRRGKKLEPEVFNKLSLSLDVLASEVEKGDERYLEQYWQVDKLFTQVFGKWYKSSGRELFESLVVALVLALLFRSFLIEPFKIPTRSMVPTLLDGDQLFVSKLSYGIRIPFMTKYLLRYDEPKRGEVVVFVFPRKEAAQHVSLTGEKCLAPDSFVEEKDYIKRVIGVAGDTVEVINQVVHVNGEPLYQEPFYEREVSDYYYLSDRRKEFWQYEEHGEARYVTISHEMPAARHWGPVKVKAGHLFVMGDNRDNSADSRCWGQVSIDNVKGRALFIWWSSGSQGPRWQRIFQAIK